MAITSVGEGINLLRHFYLDKKINISNGNFNSRGFYIRNSEQDVVDSVRESKILEEGLPNEFVDEFFRYLIDRVVVNGNISRDPLMEFNTVWRVFRQMKDNDLSLGGKNHLNRNLLLLLSKYTDPRRYYGEDNKQAKADFVVRALGNLDTSDVLFESLLLVGRESSTNHYVLGELLSQIAHILESLYLSIYKLINVTFSLIVPLGRLGIFLIFHIFPCNQ